MSKSNQTITDYFDEWMLEHGFDENDQNCLFIYTISGDRERDFQKWMQGKTDEQAFLLIDRECKEAGLE
jgi:hypothetical protein